MLSWDQVLPDDKVIYILEQGSIKRDECLEIKIQKDTRMQQLQKLAKKKFHLRVANLQFYNEEGVEILQEDLPYLKNLSSLYISKSIYT